MKFVSVVNRDTNDKILIKGMWGAMVDLSFDHNKEDKVLDRLRVWGLVCSQGDSGSGLASRRVVEVLRDGE